MNGTIQRLVPSLLYFLPGNWSGTLLGSKTTTFVSSTNVSDQAVQSQLSRAAAAPFISYSNEFSELIGPDPNITLIQERPGELFAFESVAWIPDRHEYWFTSAIYSPPGVLYVLDLLTGAIRQPKISAPWKNFQRGVYNRSDRHVYVTSWRDNDTYKGGLLRIDPESFKVSPIFNSFNGLYFSGLNDVTLVRTANASQSYYYVSDTDDFVVVGYGNSTPPSQLFTGLFRWDPVGRDLRPVISRITQPGLNAAKIGPDLRTLYVSDTLGALPGSRTPESTSTIWKYVLDDDYLPGPPQLFAQPRFFIDGLQVDDKGRVWSAEGDGVVVRSSSGSLLGVFNKLYFASETNFANVGLCGDTVVVLGVDRIWTVRLTEEVVSETSRHTFG